MWQKHCHSHSGKLSLGTNIKLGGDGRTGMVPDLSKKRPQSKERYSAQASGRVKTYEIFPPIDKAFDPQIALPALFKQFQPFFFGRFSGTGKKQQDKKSLWPSLVPFLFVEPKLFCGAALAAIKIFCTRVADAKSYCNCGVSKSSILTQTFVKCNCSKISKQIPTGSQTCKTCWLSGT